MFDYLFGKKTKKKQANNKSINSKKKKGGKLNINLKNPSQQELNDINGVGKVVVLIKKKSFEETTTETGDFINGLLNGNGKRVIKSVENKRTITEKGYFKNGKLDGEGERSKPVMLYSGIFSDGIFISGKVFNKLSKLTEEGTFKVVDNWGNVELHGKGKKYGNFYLSEGIFEHGLLKSGKRENKSKHAKIVLEKGEFTIDRREYDSNLKKGKRIFKDGTKEEGIFKTIYKYGDFEAYPVTTLEKKQKIF